MTLEEAHEMANFEYAVRSLLADNLNQWMFDMMVSPIWPKGLTRKDFWTMVKGIFIDLAAMQPVPEDGQPMPHVPL